MESLGYEKINLFPNKLSQLQFGIKKIKMKIEVFRKKHVYIIGHTLQTQTFLYSKYCQQFHKNCPGHEFDHNCDSDDEYDDDSYD
jgi:hypothetical protein